MGLHLYFPSPQVPEEHRKVRPPQPMRCQLLALLWGKKKENKSHTVLENTAHLCKHDAVLVSPPPFLFLVPLSPVFLTTGGLNR